MEVDKITENQDQIENNAENLNTNSSEKNVENEIENCDEKQLETKAESQIEEQAENDIEKNNETSSEESTEKIEEAKISNETFNEIVQHIKNYQENAGKEETQDLLASSKEIKEMFVCSVCYKICPERELLDKHFAESHEDESVDTEDDDDMEIQGIDLESVRSSERDNDTPETVSSKYSTDETESSKDEEEWLTPISLKVLKKKLNEIFTVKCSFDGCIYSFETEEKREMHEKCHVTTGTGQIRNFKCMQCQIEIKMWRECTTHMWKEHKLDIDLLKCPFCSFKAVFSVKVFRHLQIHEQMKGFLCSSCPETFEQFSQLRHHVATTHIDKDRPTRWYSQKTCDVCSNTFATSKTLSKHIKAVHNRIRPFICSVCGYKSARKSTWEIHTRQHTGEKPMTCKVCSFCTADPSVLRKHEMRHDDKTNYQCTECEYTSIQSINFKNHVKRHHPDYYQELLCDECNFVSVNLEALRKHLQDHKLGLIREEDSGDDIPEASKNMNETETNTQNRSVEISSDSFLPVESTDSLAHDTPVDTEMKKIEAKADAGTKTDIDNEFEVGEKVEQSECEIESGADALNDEKPDAEIVSKAEHEIDVKSKMESESDVSGKVTLKQNTE